jgi:DNA polymerase III sliding clamp (beta) subunit (PCNA family)
VTTVTFETATIADAVRRAVRIAPGKAGHAFDKAAGLIFEINPGGQAVCIIRATNLDAFHTEIIATVDADGDAQTWRLPSALLGNVVGTLPAKSGTHVKFTQEGRKITIQQGRMKSSMQLIDSDDYPNWDMFDGSVLTMVQGLGQRVAMVEWAAGNGEPPLAGVHLDGEYAYATDRYRLARIPCKLGIARPITIPAGILGQCLKTMGDTGVGVTGTQLLLAPDDYTQLATVIYAVDYPPIDKLFDTKYETFVEINKADMLEKLNRAGSYAGAERDPLIRTIWGKGELAVMMENPEIGLFGDVVECPGQLDHKRITLNFTPKNLIDALNNAPETRTKIYYDFTETDPKISRTVKVVSGQYECIVMKRQETKPSV